MKRGTTIVFLVMLLFAAALIGLRFYDAYKGSTAVEEPSQTLFTSASPVIADPSPNMYTEESEEELPQEIEVYVEEPDGEELVDETTDFSPIVGDYVVVLQEDETIQVG